MTAQPYWDRIAQKYSRKPTDDPAAYEEKLAQLGALLRVTDRVLEIGCGTGSTALQIAPSVAHITATDGSRGMIEIAQSKLGPDAPANVTFCQADAADMVEGRPFDSICAFSLLHLIKDVPQVLDSVRRRLKPGGLFISKNGVREGPDRPAARHDPCARHDGTRPARDVPELRRPHPALADYGLRDRADLVSRHKPHEPVHRGAPDGRLTTISAPAQSRPHANHNRQERPHMDKIETKTKLSALWLFILLNIIFRDIHQFVLKSHLEMLLTGTYNGIEVTEKLMLLGGFLVEVPIAMVLFSLLLTRRIGRPVTFVAAFITTATLFSSAPSDMDDVFHLVIELAAMAAILWTAWRWPEHDRAAA